MKLSQTLQQGTLVSTLALMAGLCSAYSQTDLMVESLEFGPVSIRTLIHPELVRFTLGNYGPDSISMVAAEYFLSRNQLLGDSDDLFIGSGEYPVDLQPFTGGSVNLPPELKALMVIPPEASGVYYPVLRISPVGSSDPAPWNNVTFGSAITVAPLTNSMYAVFADPQPTLGNMEIMPEFAFMFHSYFQNCWLIGSPGGGFSASFNAPVAGQCQLLVRHLTSSAAECPGDGYSPVSIFVNGVACVRDFDPALAHGGTHGFVEDIWTINVVEGQNTMQWVAGNLCTHYWIQRIELTPVSVPFKFQSIRPDGFGRLSLSITGQPGRTCIVEGSTDMISWTEVARVSDSPESFDVRVDIPPSEPRKFFRAIQLDP